jgi:prepilin peptidase CpaA
VEKFLQLGAFAVAVVGAGEDVCRGRIRNLLTYSSLLAALAVRSFVMGWPGLKSGLIGMLAAAGVFFVLFLAGGMGGGDVKLMGAVGAWAGAREIVPLLLATALAGGVLALVYMVFHQRVLVTLLNTLELIRHHLTSGLKPHPVLNIREPGAIRVPYGLAIAIGALYCVGQSFAGW